MCLEVLVKAYSRVQYPSSGVSSNSGCPQTRYYLKHENTFIARSVNFQLDSKMPSAGIDVGLYGIGTSWVFCSDSGRHRLRPGSLAGPGMRLAWPHPGAAAGKCVSAAGCRAVGVWPRKFPTMRKEAPVTDIVMAVLFVTLLIALASQRRLRRFLEAVLRGLATARRPHGANPRSPHRHNGRSNRPRRRSAGKPRGKWRR